MTNDLDDSVDWHDFVVVEQVDLYNDEEMLAQQTAQEDINKLTSATVDSKGNIISQNGMGSGYVDEKTKSKQLQQHIIENEEFKTNPDANSNHNNPLMLVAPSSAQQITDESKIV